MQPCLLFALPLPASTEERGDKWSIQVSCDAWDKGLAIRSYHAADKHVLNFCAGAATVPCIFHVLGTNAMLLRQKFVRGYYLA